MPFDEQPPEPGANRYVLPRYIRYARALALLSGATLGIAAGAATISITGCVQNCSGSPCPGQKIQPPPTQDGSADDATDVSADTSSNDGGSGGPRPAPLLPRAWIA